MCSSARCLEVKTTMKRIGFFVLAFLVAASMMAMAQQQDSLGSIARQMRMRKAAPPASEKVYTNDNLPTSGGLGVASASMSQTPPAPEASSDSGATTDNAQGASTAATGKKPAKSLDAEAQREKSGEEWQKKI